MNRVDFGRWKLVSSMSAERTRVPGVMKIEVDEAKGAYHALRIASGFEQAQGGGADGDNAAAGCAHVIYALCGSSCNIAMFRRA